MSGGIREELHILAALIGRFRIDLSNEKAAQVDIENILKSEDGLKFEREARLGPGDIPDFMVNDHIVIEVKLRSTTRRNIQRQLERYAAYRKVQGLMLVSNTAMAQGDEIGGKPYQFVSLGAAWL